MTEYRTKTGRVLTDEDIQALADEAERGYDVSHLLPVKKWPRGHCEHWLSERAMCGKRGRWMVGNTIYCGEHARAVLGRKPEAGATRQELRADDELASARRWLSGRNAARPDRQTRGEG